MTQQTRANFISTVASTLTDGGSNTAAEVRSMYTNDIDSCFVILSDTSDNITQGSTNLFLTSAERTILSNTSGVNTGDQTSVTGNAGTVTIVDAAADTTTWVLLGTSQTGNLSPATDAGITYNASTNALTATTFVGALTGNASTATSAATLTTARNIGGVSFNGSANIVPQTIQTVDYTSDTTCFILFGNASGSQTSGQQPKTNSTLTYNASTGILAATGFSGPLTGNVTGNVTGSSGSTTGNAATATALQTPRTINGTSFNGTANITVTAAAGTLTGTTLNATVVTSSLTSVGVIGSGTWQGAQIQATYGGTAQTSWATGDILYASGTNALAKRTIGSTEDVLQVVAGVPTWTSIGTIRQIPQNSQSTAYTLVLADAGKHILHPSADTTARIFTIPANSSVAFPIGTAITFVNQNAAGVVTIAITTDTMRLAGPGTTGSRTLAANGTATALKITSTEWIISGVGLT